MSSYVDYNSPPRSPSFGLFPTGATSPNAMAHYYSDPRQNHNMYSAFSSAATGPTSNSPSTSSKSGGTLRRYLSRNFKAFLQALIEGASPQLQWGKVGSKAVDFAYLDGPSAHECIQFAFNADII
ncbi:hypothetical protein BDV98DRAFT_602823 [Pterulicium gracile]|uniref:Uncharacterized protein n=1 Tax=Pterulicium gracile TaxID=1884261 RepID=A0A5C3QSW9_9AGAR|nr:hypothetical protein BDV98DRAFT_602823 [Pterula gracilis]